VLGGSCGSSQRQCGAARFSRASDDRALLCAVRRSGCGRYGSVRSGEGAFSAGFSHSGQRSAQSRYVQPLVSQSGPGSVSRFVSSQLQGVVAIDGKVVRRSFDRASGKSPLHMVSAWGSASMFPATMLPRAPDTTNAAGVGTVSGSFYSCPSGLGIVSHTIGSPRQIQMSLQFLF
jgi:hypothetical protein